MERDLEEPGRGQPEDAGLPQPQRALTISQMQTGVTVKISRIKRSYAFYVFKR